MPLAFGGSRQYCWVALCKEFKLLGGLGIGESNEVSLISHRILRMSSLAC